MKDKNFENLMRSKLDNDEAMVPQDAWSAIEKQLPRQRVRFNPWFRYTGVAAAVILGVMISALWWMPAGLNTGQTARITAPSQPIMPVREIPVDTAASYTPEVKVVKPVSVASSQLAHLKKTKLQPAEISVQPIEIPGSLQDEPELVLTPVVAENRKDEKTMVEPTVSYEQQLRAYEDKPIENIRVNGSNQNEKSFSVGLLASNTFFNSNSSVGENLALRRAPAFGMSEMNLTQPNYKFTHSIPLSFGLTVEKRFTSRIGIETGAVYTLLRSEYKDMDAITRGKQELHYVGIPLNLIYRFARWGRTSLYAAAGGKVDFNVSGRQIARADIETSKNTADIKLSEKPQWSLHLKAGVSYAMIDWLNVYLEPGFAYYLANNSDVDNIWKDKPATFSLQLGLRTNF